MKEPMYTTGKVAKLIQVSSRKVSQWFDEGLLGGYRLPGSQDRRIPHNELVEFLEENNMPSFGLSLILNETTNETSKEE